MVAPSSTYAVTDYGMYSAWQGALDGTYATTKPRIKRSLDWTELRALDPIRGELGKQLECVRLVGDGLRGEEAPLVITIYSPLLQAEMLAGRDLMFRNMRTHADRLRTGLNAITESTLRFVEALRRTPISGIVYITEHASYEIMSEEEYLAFAAPYDVKILEALPSDWWLNIAQIRGQAPMLGVFSGLPIQIFNWQAVDGRPDIGHGLATVPGAICGGLASEQDILYGTPSTIRDAARQAITETGNRRLVLSAGTIVSVAAPRSNLRAAREVVESVRA